MKDKPVRKQMGARIDAALYRQVRAIALLQGVNTGEIIDEAIKLYLKQRSQRTMERTK